MPDVDKWLGELGLSEYVAAFKDNAIGFDQLTRLDHDILKDIGVNAVGHRMKILAAAEKIGEPSKLLASTDKKAVQQAKQASEREPEHRQVTVLFADIAEYTPLAEKLGAEKTFELIQSVLKEMIDTVESHGGTIQDIAGDAVLALFGAPTAIEDATLLACKSALDMQNRMAELADRFNTEYRVSPSLRIGIHIGPVVVGEIGAETRTQRKAVGDTVNMASRLETAAEPGTVLISEATYKLVEGRVESAFAGERQFKGKAEAQRVYRLVGLKSGVSRFDAVASRGLTPMVEREVELETLSRCWNQASQGQIRVANVVGEAGIGKSRLAHEFRERVEDSRPAFLRGHCAAESRSTPFLPFIEVIRRAYRIGSERDADTVKRKIRDGLEMVGLRVDRHLPYLANLLGVEVGDALSKVDPETIGIRTRETLQTILTEQCRMSPVVMFIDDLHWIDTASEAYLLWMAQTNEAMPLLVLCTYRPEYHPPWAGCSNVTELALDPLSVAGTTDMLKQRIGAEQLPPELTAFLVEKTEGNPLFVEEMANYLVETGQIRKSEAGMTYFAEDTRFGLPTTLENLLMQRIDRLGEAPRQVMKVASVIGGPFAPELVGDVGELSGGVTQLLDDLTRQDLLVVESSKSTINYRVKHALIRDVVYHSLLSKERESLHLAVAEAIERRYAGHENEAADTLAHHYGRTDRVEETIRYLYLAGQKSLLIYSIAEAHQGLRQALDLVDAHPGVVDQDFTTDLILANSRAYYLLGDYARMIPMVEQYLPVVEAQADKRRLSHCLSELGHAHMDTARPATAEALLERALALGQEINDESAVGHAAMVLAAYQVFWQPPGPGRSESVQRLAEQAFEIGKRTEDSWLAAEALAVLGYFALGNGNPREGRRQAQRLMELNRTNDNPYAAQLALYNLAMIDNFNLAPEEAIQKADEALRIGLSPLFRSHVNACKGSAMAMTGQAEEAYELMREIRQEAVDKDQFFVFASMDYNFGVAQVLRGDIADGVRWIEKSRRWFEELGFHPVLQTVGHLTLGEVYLGMAVGGEKPALAVVLKNLGFLLRTLPFAAKKARHHLEEAERSSRAYDWPGFLAWSLMDLGLLAQAKKNSVQARAYLEEAYSVAQSVDAFAIVEKSKAALAELA